MVVVVLHQRRRRRPTPTTPLAFNRIAREDARRNLHPWLSFKEVWEEHEEEQQDEDDGVKNETLNRGLFKSERAIERV